MEIKAIGEFYIVFSERHKKVCDLGELGLSMKPSRHWTFSTKEK